MDLDLMNRSDLSRYYWSVSVLLLFVCRGAIEPAVVTGRMVITEGAVFSEELRNSSSLQFKSLAFDVQELVRAQAFILKENKWI